MIPKEHPFLFLAFVGVPICVFLLLDCVWLFTVGSAVCAGAQSPSPHWLNWLVYGFAALTLPLLTGGVGFGLFKAVSLLLRQKKGAIGTKFVARYTPWFACLWTPTFLYLSFFAFVMGLSAPNTSPLSAAEILQRLLRTWAQFPFAILVSLVVSLSLTGTVIVIAELSKLVREKFGRRSL